MANRPDFFNLIISGGNSGAINMAKDLHLLNRYKSLDDFTDKPTLRLYFFSPPALSLGFFQKRIDPELINKAKERKYDIVRRPTGGRAVLHKSEVTYSVVSSFKKGIFAGNLLDSYKKISAFLFTFFIKLGLQPDEVKSDTKTSYRHLHTYRHLQPDELENNTKTYRHLQPDELENNAEPLHLNVNASHFETMEDNILSNKNNNDSSKNDIERKNFNCFLKAHSYEITIKGKKICGSSQRRNESAFLQHGSIYIDYNPLEHLELFEKGGQIKEYFDNVTSIKQELDKINRNAHLDYDHLINLLKISFEETYSAQPKSYSFTQDELTEINNLCKDGLFVINKIG